MQQTPQLPEGRRVYAVGDVHGCLPQLTALLARIGADCAARPASHVTLIFLGDYIDRGPDSAGVVETARARPDWAQETITLKGNHEEMLERFFADSCSLAQWCQFGGLETLASYGLDPKEVAAGQIFAHAKIHDAFMEAFPETHDEFFAGLQHSYSAGGYFFCHAGVRPGIPLERQRPNDLLWIREDFLHSTADFGRVVVHGHTRVKEPELLANRINVDTGAYSTGRLTCAVLEADRIDFITVGPLDLPRAD
ncbi:MAG: metallophosphoesterase family protein [Hyphomicrobiaceae bacterium]